MPELTKCDCDDKYLCEVEYDRCHAEHYDGISEWVCANCGQRVGRWTKKILGPNECEPRCGRERNR